MNKTELIASVAQKTELTKKDAEKAVKAVFDTVAEELAAGGKVQVIGFGTFEVRERAAREGRNPQNGKTITIAASKSPAFKAGKGLKEQVNATKAKKTQKIIPKGYERDLSRSLFFVFLWYNAQRKGAL